jgi:hypothetical protein
MTAQYEVFNREKMAVFWVVAPCSLVEIALMMEAARTSATLVNFYQTTRCFNPEDSHLHTHRRENLKSYYSTGDRHILFPKSVILTSLLHESKGRALGVTKILPGGVKPPPPPPSPLATC